MTPADLDQIIADHAPRLRSALRSAFAKVRADVAPEDVADAIEEDRIDRVLSAVGIENGTHATLDRALSGDPRIALVDAFADGAAIASRDGTFIPGAPVAREADARARRTLDTLATAAVAATARMARAALMDGTGDPIGAALRIIGAIGLTTRQVDATERLRSVLVEASARIGRGESPGFVSSLVARTLAIPLRGRLRRAIEAGELHQSDVDRIVADQMTALTDARLATVADIETTRAAHAGELAAWQWARDARVISTAPLKFWRDVGDERVRAAHSATTEMNAAGVALDAPFLTPLGAVAYPPLEPGCRCRIEYRVPRT